MEHKMMDEEECKCGSSNSNCAAGPCGNRRRRCWVMRFVMLLLIVSLAFGCGASFARHRLAGGYGDRYGMMGGRYGGGMMGGWFDRDGERGERNGVTQVFGTISKVEGNKITLRNNEAKDQMVLSLATTVIVANGTEVPLSSLKADQNVVVMGAVNKDTQQVEARMIKVL